MRFCLECGTPLADSPLVIDLQGEAERKPSDLVTASFGKSRETQFGGRQVPSHFADMPPKRRGGGKIFLIAGGIFALFLLFSAAAAALVLYNWDEIAGRFDPAPTPAPTAAPAPTAEPTATPTATPAAARTPVLRKKEASAVFDRMSVDYNVIENGRKGMRIHVDFSTLNLKGVNSYLAIYFEKKDGSPILTNNRDYRSTTGQLMVYQKLTPAYDNTVYKDITLFMPYDELSLSRGRHDLRMEISVIHENGDLVTQLERYDFWYEQP